MSEIQARQTAYKVYIGDLHRGNYVRSSGEWEPNYIAVNGLNISRVNLIGVVIDIFSSESSNSLILDDGSSTITIRAFKDDAYLFSGVKVGDVVIAVGRTREFNSKIYIAPEIIKVIDALWLKFRKKELGEYKIEEAKEKAIVNNPPEYTIENVVDEGSVSGRYKILGIVDNAGASGIDILNLIGESLLPVVEAKKIIDDLLKEGEIFEIAPGKVRII